MSVCVNRASSDCFRAAVELLTKEVVGQATECYCGLYLAGSANVEIQTFAALHCTQGA